MEMLHISPNIRADAYSIVKSQTRCLSCNAITAVWALSVPAGYESLIAHDDTPIDEPGEWEEQPLAAVLSYVEYVSETVGERISAMTPHYRFEQDAFHFGSLWANHCEQCGAQFNEEELHEDLDNPFGRMASMELNVPVETHEVREPFEAWAGSETHELGSLDS